MVRDIGRDSVFEDEDGDETYEQTEGDGIAPPSVDTGVLTHDYSDTYPQSPRQPESEAFPRFDAHPNVTNPVITKSDISEATAADGAADPFLVYDRGEQTYYLFFEAVEHSASDHTIHYATSRDGLNWSYQGQLSGLGSGFNFPYTFAAGGTWRMVPGDAVNGEVALYNFDPFPGSVTKQETLLPTDTEWGDPVVFEWDGRWWIFTYDIANTDIHAFYADSLTGNWTAHDNNPVISTADKDRCAGRPLVREEAIYLPRRPKSERSERTVEQVEVFRIDDLTPSSYSHSKVATSPVIAPHQNGWNHINSHHIDAMVPRSGGQAIAAVDGRDDNTEYSIGIYTPAESPTAAAKMVTNTTVTASSGAWTEVQFDTVNSAPEAFDTIGMADTANYEMVVPTSGYYRINVAVGIAAPSTSGFRWIVRIRNRTDGTNLAFKSEHLADASYINTDPSCLVRLQEGDSIGIDVYQDSGSGQDINDSNAITYFEMERMR